MIRRLFLTSRCLLPCGLLLACGCRMTVLEPSAGDDLRLRMMELEESNRILRLEKEGLMAEIDRIDARADLRVDDSSLRAATPRLSAIEISASSVIEAPEGGARTLSLRLDPSDERGRFLQVVGSLSVRAVAVRTGSPPRTLALGQFSPVEMRDAWRGGFFGSVYVLEIPLNDAPEESLPDTVDVVINFTDAVSGREFRDERAVRVSSAGL